MDFENGVQSKYSKYVRNDVADSVIIDEKTIVFTRVTCQCFRGFRGVVHNNLFIVHLNENDEIDEDYLYVVLCSDFVKRQALRFAQSSVVPDLSHDMFKSILIPIPDRKSQKEIVSIHEALVTKIANNDAICEDLEAMAKLLYDYWFVQFDFPDENGRPYKSSGGKMVWNDELKREIPEGWQVLQLGEIAHYSSEKTDVSTLSSDNYIGNDNLLDDMHGRRGSEHVPVEGFATRYRFGDTLVGNIRPYFKKIWLADGDGGSSADVLVVVPNERDEYCFVFASLSRDDFFSYDLAGAKGSKMPRGDKEHIMSYPIVYCEEAICEFTDVVSKWYELRAEIYYENQDLESLRDFLLPMLMNGQVKVAS